MIDIINQKTKKIVAREILIAVGTALVIGLPLLIIQWRISFIESRSLAIRSMLPEIKRYEIRLGDFASNAIKNNRGATEKSDSLVREWIEKETAKDKRLLKSVSDYRDELNTLRDNHAYFNNLNDSWLHPISIGVLSIVYPFRFIVLILIWAIRVYFKSE